MQKFSLLIQFFFAGLFILAGLGGLTSGEPLPAAFSIALGVYLIPQFRTQLFNKISTPVQGWKKFGIGVALLLGFMAVLPASETSPETPTATVETQSAEDNSEAQQTENVEPDATVNSNRDSFEPLLPVVSVTDGDTFKVEIEGKTETIRLVGVNTPETVDPRKPVECFGREASNALKNLLNEKAVYLEKDATQSDRDRYDRLLRFAFLDDGTDVGLWMIKEGYAEESLYSDTPHEYHDEYVTAEKDAREAKRGLWADDACPVPTPTPSSTPTPKPTAKSTATPKPYVAPTTAPKPTATPYQAPVAPAPQTDNGGGGWTCNCAKTCPQMSSCAEAQYQLNSCGCGARDADKDGIACDADCQ